MNRIEALEKRIIEAALQLTQLKDERKKLKAELESLEQENRQLKNLSNSDGSWKEEKRTLAGRIEKLLKKINALKPHS